MTPSDYANRMAVMIQEAFVDPDNKTFLSVTLLVSII